MIEVEISDKMLLLARKKAVEMGTLFNSILNGGGNFAGLLGELVANEVLNGSIENTKDYDILLTNGKTVDIKTKQTTVEPKKEYECSISAFNIKQKCNAYVFVRVKKDFSKGQVLGYMTKDNFFKKANFLKKGEVHGDNNFTVRSDCYNVKISDLQSVKSKRLMG